MGMRETDIQRRLEEITSGQREPDAGYPETATAGCLAFFARTDGGAVCEQFTGQRWVQHTLRVARSSIAEI